MNEFKYTLDNKRYHTLNYYNRTKYGEKIYKAVIDAGFSCPNIDGTKGTGGCIYCDSGSGYFTKPLLSPKEQLEAEIARIHKKNEAAKVVAYFQAHTNTYAPLDKLKEAYEQVLSNKYVAGISIGTRPDCISNETADYLAEISQRTNLTVELGLQSVHEKTAEIINRCYSFGDFLKTYLLLKNKKIRVCVHIINGLPFETEQMMIETAKEIGSLKPDGIKIHSLHVISGTKLAEMHGTFPMLTREQYVDIVVSQLEQISAETVIERITGDGDKSKLIAPLWSADKIAVLGAIDKRMAELDTWQGKSIL